MAPADRARYDYPAFKWLMGVGMGFMLILSALGWFDESGGADGRLFVLALIGWGSWLLWRSVRAGTILIDEERLVLREVGRDRRIAVPDIVSIEAGVEREGIYRRAVVEVVDQAGRRHLTRSFNGPPKAASEGGRVWEVAADLRARTGIAGPRQDYLG